MAAKKPVITLQQLLRYWYSDLKAEQVASKLGISRTCLYKLGKRYKLPKRDADKRTSRAYKIDYDPTPQEIEAAAQDIRASWSETESERRFVGSRRKDWAPPAFSYSSRTGVFVSKS